VRHTVARHGPHGVPAALPVPLAAERQATPGRAGRPVPDALRARMEAAFGADFSTVTVHEGEEPAAVGARALTSGEAITLRPGVGASDTVEGAQVLGHELAHVLQQREGRVGGSGLTEDPALEAEADEAGHRAAQGEPVGSAVSGGAAPGAVSGGVAQPMRRSGVEPAGDLFEPEGDLVGQRAARNLFSMPMPAAVAAEPGGYGVSPVRRYGALPLAQVAPAPPVIHGPPPVVPEHPYDPPEHVPGSGAEASDLSGRDRRTSL
jgi:hypothetical protein